LYARSAANDQEKNERFSPNKIGFDYFRPAEVVTIRSRPESAPAPMMPDMIDPAILLA
jgi:hypothetical protein